MSYWNKLLLRGDDELGAALMTAAMAQRLRHRGKCRGGSGRGGGRLGGDEIGAEELAGELDDADAAEMGDDIQRADAIGYTLGAHGPEDDLRKLEKQAEKYQDVIDKADRKLISMPDWRRRKSRKLTAKRDEAAQKLAATRAKISEIKARMAREARGGGAGGGVGGGGYGGGLTPSGAQVAQEVEVDNMRARAYGIYANLPPHRINNELPVLFSGSNFALINFPATTVAGTEGDWSGTLQVPSYMRIRLKGVKIVASLQAVLAPSSTTILDQTNKAWINVDNLTVDGGINLVAAPYTVNLESDTMGRSNEFRMADGLRATPVVESKTDITVGGTYQNPFTVVGAFNVNFKAAVIFDLLHDTNQDGPF